MTKKQYQKKLQEILDYMHTEEVFYDRDPIPLIMEKIIELRDEGEK